MEAIRKVNAVNYRHMYFDPRRSMEHMTMSYIDKYGSITSDEAYEAFNCRRLAAVIFNLRKHYDIITERGDDGIAIYSFQNKKNK